MMLEGEVLPDEKAMKSYREILIVGRSVSMDKTGSY